MSATSGNLDPRGAFIVTFPSRPILRNCMVTKVLDIGLHVHVTDKFPLPDPGKRRLEMILNYAGEQKEEGKDYVFVPGKYNSDTQEYEGGTEVRVLLLVLKDGKQLQSWKRLEERAVSTNETCFSIKGKADTDCQEDGTFILYLGPNKQNIMKVKGNEVFKVDGVRKGTDLVLSYGFSSETEFGAELQHIHQTTEEDKNHQIIEKDKNEWDRVLGWFGRGRHDRIGSN